MDIENLSKISAEDITNLRKAALDKVKRIDSGLLAHKYFKKPITVKILMLVDSGISYSHFYFGLSEVLNTLYNNPEWWVKFDITRAHRFDDPITPTPGTMEAELYAPHFEDFRFNQAGFNLNDYDQLWLFGFNNSASFPQALNTDELEIVYQWMNEHKGGILAMGDHAQLGASLCSEIPRVRNMRKWRVDVPSNVGADRHDTLYKGHDDPLTSGIDESVMYTFDDESDDVPMRITPRWYYSHLHTSIFRPKHFIWDYRRKRFPHPVLCGKDGVINVLPDHPHEGEVVEPTDLNDVLSFNSYSHEEYPKLGARRLRPEIIAWAHVQDDHTAISDINKGAANQKTFGAIGAYDGHCVDVGRVVVDSTWHHWFDVNLNGRLIFGTGNSGFNNFDDSNDPRKLNGFNDSAAGVQAYEKIKNYFRNVAIWLTPPKKLRKMACVALWNSLYRYPLYADFHVKLPVWELGHHAINVLGKYAGQCQVRGWWVYFVPQSSLERIFNDRVSKMPSPGLDNIDEFILGGIMQSLLSVKDDFLSGKVKMPSDNELDELVLKGIETGTKELVSFMRSTSLTENNLRKTLSSFSKLI